MQLQEATLLPVVKGAPIGQKISERSTLLVDGLGLVLLDQPLTGLSKVSSSF
jgi:hypothetical protein